MTMEASFRLSSLLLWDYFDFSQPACFTLYILKGSLNRKNKPHRENKVTLARASRDASASAAMALCSCTGSFTSLISTRSTLIPQSSVASPWEPCCFSAPRPPPSAGLEGRHAALCHMRPETAAQTATAQMRSTRSFLTKSDLIHHLL
uniref:Uncharacterized protein n=1 Tax=Capra hircus TaxID=9925 RepID=A0A8C2PND7_CAPHI